MFLKHMYRRYVEKVVRYLSANVTKKIEKVREMKLLKNVENGFVKRFLLMIEKFKKR